MHATTTRAPTNVAAAADLAYQERILQGVSRTFALTIPELPGRLCEVVGNGYLLCRIADTIEDDPELSFSERQGFHREFLAVLEDGTDAASFASVAPRLAAGTLDAERDLVANTARVVAITRSFNEAQRTALTRCVRVMCQGMDRFQPTGDTRGLRDVGELHEYCYHVAGVVGEMLTELFCDYSPEIEAKRGELTKRAVSFGWGLQMTNILKDVWDDLERGFCWLPRDIFQARGVELADLKVGGHSPGFEQGIDELVAIAHGHLCEALEYTLLLPSHERGLRNFCLWSVGMAVLTLRKIHKNPGFNCSSDVKIKRSSVKATVFTSNALSGSNRMLRAAFFLCAGALPAPKFENGR